MIRERYNKFFENFYGATDSCKLDEGIVSPKYYKEIASYLNNFKSEIQDKKTNKLETLCFLLTRKLNKYAIHFLVDYKNEKGVEEYHKIGITKSKCLINFRKTINIECNNNLLLIQDSEGAFNYFIEAFIKVLGHELIHRYQMFEVRKRKIRKFIFDHSELEIVEYLRKKQEIMSRAWQIIEEFRYRGIHDDEILRIMQSDKNVRIVSYSPMLMIYLDHFHIKDPIFKTLYKYIYLYLTDNIESEKELNAKI